MSSLPVPIQPPIQVPAPLLSSTACVQVAKALYWERTREYHTAHRQWLCAWKTSRAQNDRVAKARAHASAQKEWLHAAMGDQPKAWAMAQEHLGAAPGAGDREPYADPGPKPQFRFSWETVTICELITASSITRARGARAEGLPPAQGLGLIKSSFCFPMAPAPPTAEPLQPRRKATLLPRRAGVREDWVLPPLSDPAPKTAASGDGDLGPRSKSHPGFAEFARAGGRRRSRTPPVTVSLAFPELSELPDRPRSPLSAPGKADGGGPRADSPCSEPLEDVPLFNPRRGTLPLLVHTSGKGSFNNR